jgi:outer membrane murein-binding lipoprotein Lpp
VVESKQKDDKVWKISTLVASFIAICGIGFGIYGVISTNSIKTSVVEKDNKINDLNTEIENLNSKIEELESQTEEQPIEYEAWDEEDEEPDAEPTVDRNLTADVQNGVFILMDKNGKIVAKDNSKNLVEMVSCDSGTAGSSSILKCTAKDEEGKDVWFTYDFESKELKSGY